MRKIYIVILSLNALLFANQAFAQTQNLTNKVLTINEVPSNSLRHFSNEVRVQYQALDFSILDEHQIFTIQLFDQQVMSFKFEKDFHYTNGAFSWYGKSIFGSGDIILSFYQGFISGKISSDSRTKIMIQQINGTSIFALSEVAIDAMQESPLGTNDYIIDGSLNKKTRANSDVCAAGSLCPGASVIDLMVLGSADAITDGGGTVPSFVANVTTAVTEMNTAYTNSGGTNGGGGAPLFNLIHCDATSFTTTSNMSNDLTNFSTDASVLALRNSKGADLVGLWAGSGNYAGFCGLGYLNTNPTNYNSNSAFTVTDYGCGMTNLSYAHECGHNMGFRHDYYVDNSTSPCDHHHGCVNQAVIPSGTPVSARWRTILAYNNECSDNGFNCSREAYWSNPNINYLGSPTGIAIGQPEPAYEMYGLDRLRCVVSTFRTVPFAVAVQLMSFDVKSESNDIILKWITTNENNNKGFEVQIKNGFGEEFKTIGFVAGQGNSSQQNSYLYKIVNNLAGTYYLRLKQIDIDGNYTYSEVKKIDLRNNDLQANIFPNPAKGNFTISLYSPKLQLIKIALYDMMGNEVKNLFEGNCAEGTQSLVANVQDISKGIYFLRLSTNNSIEVTKVIIE